ncbi:MULTISPECIES: DUF7527 domain-containing protein [Haloferax]|uniref:DUF7527 domain-containing protein n=1 Tax=Haloferax massiliensis TaxID=1476858 RepID=A0A0D6JS23_9EURY|nr:MULTISPECIES: hypothetical protein [Haloferax]MDS0240264.1 hypothetical protein [Haloferax sp. S2CR25]MDS0443385.1 hypothetical protein [Haloferax sp. S2CR25-2]CQR50380.1 hypothetical protein BN996_01860 [Haloferax massiliensis]
MDSEIIDAVTGWDSAPAERGHGGLRSLADDGFTGAVVAGMTWGFMLNGRLLGVFDGTVDDFEGESFEAYRAPDSALPLLYAMRETGGDVRAQYYTEETPLQDADGTLSAGGFTGYVELSENVLSGDYYVVYHGGKSMSAAFVGNSRRLITGDEAFERASDEVGIYKVYDVDIDLVDIPGGDPDEEADETAGVAAGGVAPAGDEEVEDDAEGADDPAAADEPAAFETADADDDTDKGEPVDDGSADEEPTPAVSADAAADDAEPSDSSTPDDGETEATPDPSAPPSGPQSPAQAEPTTPPAKRPAPEESESRSPTAEGSVVVDTPQKNGEQASPEPPAGDDATGDDVFSAEAQWRNARSIPSLDPRDAEGESVDGRPGTPRSHQRNTKQATHHRPSRGGAGGGSRPSPEDQPTQQQSQPAEQTPEEPAVDPAEAESLKQRVEALASERDRLESERDALREERDEHRSRAEELEDRVAELESEVERLRGQLDEAGIRSTDRSMSADEALRGTNLFVRYARKGEATLEKAHDGQASREEVVENLRLEHHTTFDTEGLGIDGQPYEEFLHETPEYGFAKWVVTDLLYEIGETGNRSSLAGVFDSIPKADRIELYGSVSIPLGDGESESRQFDIIVRDQMGEPLFVANLNDSRDPATRPMVTQLIKDSKSVANAKETLGSAFVVTKSFFEPGALEAATEETGGGLLSRSKRKSFVKLSRKQGYHLCLVEARGGEFHLNVPDL